MNAPISDEQLHELLSTELPRELAADEPPELVHSSLLRARRIHRRRVGGVIIAGVVAAAVALTGVIAVPRLVSDHTAPPPPIIGGGPSSTAVVPTIRLNDTMPTSPVTVPYFDTTTSVWHKADGSTVQLPALPKGHGPLVQAPIETSAGLFVEWWNDAAMSTASYRVGAGKVMASPAGLGVGYPYEGGVMFDYQPPNGSDRLYQLKADGTAGPLAAPFDADHELQGTTHGTLWAGNMTSKGTVDRNGAPVPGYLSVAWTDPTAGVVALWQKVNSECQDLVRGDDLTVLTPHVCGTILAISPDATRLLISTARDTYVVIDTATGKTLSTITVDSKSPANSGGHSVQAQFVDADHVILVTNLTYADDSSALISIDLATGVGVRVTDHRPEDTYWLVRQQ